MFERVKNKFVQTCNVKILNIFGNIWVPKPDICLSMIFNRNNSADHRNILLILLLRLSFFTS